PYLRYESALVANYDVTHGTAYTLRKKAETLINMELPEQLADSLMTISNGDSIIVNRPLTTEERKKLSPADPSKAPKNTYEASPYFQRAVAVLEEETPAKWSKGTADTFAHRILRVAARLRGAARSGKKRDH